MKRDFIDEWEEFAYQNSQTRIEKSCVTCVYWRIDVKDEPCRSCVDRSKWKGYDNDEQTT